MSLRRRIRRNRERRVHGAPLRNIAGRRALRCPVCRAHADKAKGCRECGGYGWLIEAQEDDPE